MTTASWPLYGAYFIWLCAGCIDFLCHRRADLANTSGLPESLLHLLQTALMALMVIVWMTVAPGLGPLLLMATLVVAHPQVRMQGWSWSWRAPAYTLSVWTAVLLPAFALCVLPLARELWTARQAMRKGAGP